MNVAYRHLGYYLRENSDIERSLEIYFDRLWPLHRSITGEGVRETLSILSEIIPFDIHEVPSGAPVLDWEIPKEWVVRQAYVITPAGEKILDVKENNLHLLNYSIPFRGKISRSELDKHLYSLPEQPTAVPYRTSYYEPNWGFCISHRDRDQLPEGEYEVVIDTELKDGFLTIGDFVIKGDLDEEIIFTTYTCHPSMAINEISGMLVLAFLAQKISKLPERRYTYRFVFGPETIGSIAYLAQWGKHLKEKMTAGYCVTCVGHNDPFTYKESRRGDSIVDRMTKHVLEGLGVSHSIIPFSPSGSEERQYCAPGFNLPYGSLMRTLYGDYPEYHTSLDNKDIIDFSALSQTIQALFEVVRAYESNITCINNKPYGEPRLSKHNLYVNLGGPKAKDWQHAVKWLLNYSDGDHDLLEIARKSGYDIHFLRGIADVLMAKRLVSPIH